MLSSANKLANAGADFLISPDNTIHHAFDLVAPRSPLPWLHIVDEVAAVAKSRGFHKLAITGTKYTIGRHGVPDKVARRRLRLPRARCR